MITEIKKLKEQSKDWDSVEGFTVKVLLEIAEQLEKLNNNLLKLQEKIDLPIKRS